MEMGSSWSRKQWAYARMGDMFTSRVPAELSQKANEAFAKSDDYISNYNIFVGYLKDNEGNTFFPKDLKLISHWNLRDELKSHYGKSEGLDKQKIIYEVMKRIISQEIPYSVINSDKYYWNPYENKVYDVSEDKNFWRLVKKQTDYRIVIDPKIQVGHVTTQVVTPTVFEGFKNFNLEAIKAEKGEEEFNKWWAEFEEPELV